jgi:glycosyltransferase involved in cell wall biosynthesis
MKPKILVIVDVPGWALERTADNVMARLSGRYDFEKAFNKNAVEKIRARKFDLLYITYETQFQDANIAVDIPQKAVTGVRCHFKWDGGGKGLPPSAAFLSHLGKFVALNVPSKILCTIFSPLHPAVFYTPHGVDTEIFRPRAGNPFSSPAGELVLGWAGSLTNHPGKRGVEDYLMPAIKGLKGVSLRLAAREQKWRTQEEMVAFYQGVDVQVCASSTEGGPHPLLEAAACGIPLISTRVGLAPELIKDGDNGFLIERDIEAIRDAVITLRDNRDMRCCMGKRAREIVAQDWNWDTQAKNYAPFFDYGLNNAIIYNDAAP